MDNGYGLDLVYLDNQKAFNTVLQMHIKQAKDGMVIRSFVEVD